MPSSQVVTSTTSIPGCAASASRKVAVSLTIAPQVSFDSPLATATRSGSRSSESM